MKTTSLIAVFSFPLILGQSSAEPPKALYPDVAPVCSCESLTRLSLPNTTIDSAAIDPSDGSCRVTATVTHPPTGDRVRVFIGLPTKGWNGRFYGTGGGAFTGGSEGSLRGPVALGFAAGATDTGHEGGSASFALDEKGRLNWQAIVDNAYLGIHEMTVLGKALTKAYYGKAPRYCYFVGNSTGGRQGLVEAQRYPEDYDGIVSGCPAINWDRFVPAFLWPHVVMASTGSPVPQAKFEAATAAAVAACDELDGLKDGIIGEPWRCSYDPRLLVGTKVGDGIFTAADAEVVRKIWEGPRGEDGSFLWYGIPRGARIGGGPHGVGLGWFRYFLVQNPEWDWKTLTRAGFERRFQQSVEQFGAVFGNENPDLTRFRDRGGKVIVFHGIADSTIPVWGSIDYCERIQQRMGGEEKTAEFARLFLAPGVEHNLRGPGPAPTGTFEAILSWVEEGKAPDLLIAEQADSKGKVVARRPLFPYPHVARYKGNGSPDDAENFVSIRSPALPTATNGKRGADKPQTHVYKTVGNLPIKADVYRPDDGVVRPVVVWIHGGALINGHREQIPGLLKDPLLAAGCILVSIDYRLAPETKLPGIIEDLEDAFRWIRQQGPRLFNADPDRVAVVGGSAGGYLTLTAGFRARPRPVALVALWGYGDLVGPWYSTPSPHPAHHRLKPSREEAYQQAAGPPIADARDRKGNGGAFYQFCRQQGLWPQAVSGWDPHTEAEKFFPYMPVKNVTADFPPTLLVHGEEDTDVPCAQSEMMAAALRANNVEHRLITYPKAEHGLADVQPAKVEEAYAAAVAFLRAHLERQKQ